MGIRKERKTVEKAKNQAALKRKQQMREAMYLMQFCPFMVRLRLAYHVVWKTDLRKAKRLIRKTGNRSGMDLQ